MSCRITEFDAIEDLRRASPHCVDIARMTDWDLDRLSRAAEAERTFDESGMNAIEPAFIALRTIAEAVEAGRGSKVPVERVADVAVAIGSGAIDLLWIRDEQRARAERLQIIGEDVAFEIDRRIAVLAETGGPTPLAPDGGLARNFDGDVRNDVEQVYTASGEPVYRTVGDWRHEAAVRGRD